MGYALIEYADDLSLTEEEWDNPLLQDYLQKSNHVILWHNDIVSFEKEWIEQNKQLERMSNVVAWTAIIEKCTIEKAMEKVCDLYPEIENKAMKAMERLLETEISRNMETFIDRVSHTLSGNFCVGYLIDRYNKIYH